METEKEMTAIQKTQVYLENYREIERYIKDAISEVSQIDDVSRYNISAEKAFLQSIRECKAETVILFEHMKKALASLKEDAEAAGEGYKYDALEAVYIKGKSYEDIVRETGCGKNSPKKWCRSMTELLQVSHRCPYEVIELKFFTIQNRNREHSFSRLWQSELSCI